MRRLFFRRAGLCLAPLIGLGMAVASELESQHAVSNPSVRPINHLAPQKGEPVCGSHGTSVEFVATPSEAAKIAKKEQKLVFVLHVSGNFEEPRFT